MADKVKAPAGLQKISALLKQMGISEEATKEFVAVCESWHGSEKENLKQEFKTRLEKAKKLCVEEVEAHKANLSRGVKIFLEHQGDVIRKASEKSAAIAESEAVNKLKQINNLLGGINVDSAVNAQTLQVESKKNADLVSQVALLQESLNKEKAKSAKLGELSTKSLSRQKDLEKGLNESRALLIEAKNRIRKGATGATTLSEHKVKPKTPISVKSVARSSVGTGSTVKESKDNDQIDLIAASLD